MKSKWSDLCAIALALTMVDTASAQLYFAGQFGPDNTWNVYETRGLGTFNGVGRQAFVGGATIVTGSPKTWVDAEADARNASFSFSGVDYSGYLVSLGQADVAAAQAENDFIANHGDAPRTDHWIGLTDSAIYGGADAGTDDAHTDRNAGWVWSSGEAFHDITRWGDGEPNDCCDGEDAVQMRGDNRWNDHGNGVTGDSAPLFPYVVEYATSLPEDPGLSGLPALDPTIRRTPGPRSMTDGKMAIREIYQNGFVSGNAGALRSAFAPGGVVYDYEAPVMNIFNSGGEGAFGSNRNYGLIESGLVPAADLDDVAVIAHGRIRIPEGQAGVYTFGFNTDDSGELWIYDKAFSNVVNGEPSVNGPSPYGSLLFALDRGPGHTLGQVTLEPGDYDFEFVANERGGGSEFELYTAKGAFTAFDENAMQSVGAPAVNFQGTTPKVSDPGWTVREVMALPESTNFLNTLAQAKALSAAPDGDDLVENGLFDGINLSDPDTDGLASGQFAGDRPFLVDGGRRMDENDFVMRATATLEVTTAGEYTFGFESGEGAELTVIGASFTNISSVVGAVITNGGQSITADVLTGTSLSTAVTHLEPGNYPIEFWTWERGGGAFAEVFVAPLALDSFDPRLFRILDNTNQVLDVNVQAGLQLVKQVFEPDCTLLGDTNCDHDVDLSDLSNVRNFFGTGDTTGDADHDGDTDLDDLNTVRNAFTSLPSAPASVPEPSSFPMWGFGAVALLAARKSFR